MKLRPTEASKTAGRKGPFGRARPMGILGSPTERWWSFGTRWRGCCRWKRRRRAFSGTRKRGAGVGAAVGESSAEVVRTSRSCSGTWLETKTIALRGGRRRRSSSILDPGQRRRGRGGRGLGTSRRRDSVRRDRGMGGPRSFGHGGVDVALDLSGRSPGRAQRTARVLRCCGLQPIRRRGSR